MNTAQVIFPGSRGSKKQSPIGSEPLVLTAPLCSGRRLGRVLGIIGAVAVIAFIGILSPVAFGANPADEMFKTGATHGGTDPQGNSWMSIQRSLEQFAHPEFMLRLFLSLGLAVVCAWVVAWHPRRSGRMDPLTDLEERKTLILLGMVGAIVAELSGSSQTLAFVIFGIGSLLRFRTAARQSETHRESHHGRGDRARLRHGLMGDGGLRHRLQLAARLWLDSHVVCRIRIRFEEDVDPSRCMGWCSRCSSPTIADCRKFRAEQGQTADGVLRSHAIGTRPKTLEGQRASKAAGARQLRDRYAKPV